MEYGWVVWDGARVDTVVCVASTEEFAKKRMKEINTSKKLKVQKMAWNKAFLLWEKGNGA